MSLCKTPATHQPTRRSLLSTALLAPLLPAQSPDRALFSEVFQAVWTAVNTEFYDPALRGVNWLQVKQQFAPRVLRCVTKPELLSLLRQMLRRLHNSHLFLYSREEWDLRQHILPFHFQKAGENMFIRQLLPLTTPSTPPQYAVGDQILAVGESSSPNLRPYSLAALDEVTDNPNFGLPQSVVELKLRRGTKTFHAKARRVHRLSEVKPFTVTEPAPGVTLIQLPSLNADSLPQSQLRELWTQIRSSRALILDLRNSVGGDPSVSNFIAGGLLGEEKLLFREIPRPGTSEPVTTQYSSAGVPRFSGKAALLINGNTESQPELLAAICQEYGCARLYGTRTAGAFNGFTKAIPLPQNFARFALPYTRGLSPHGRDYEGRGVTPDQITINTEEDYARGIDRPLLLATAEMSQ